LQTFICADGLLTLSCVAALNTVVTQPAPAWKIWGGLWTIYIVWGSTYLAIRVMVETVPPLLGAGARFTVAGAVMLAVLAVKRSVRPTRAQLLSALLVGALLPGANAVVTVAEQEVPSGIAALLIASVPLIVILLRRATGDHVPRASVGAVLVGFAGVALLLRPGEQSGDATVLGLGACVIAAVMWATGSFASPRLTLPRDPLVSTGWQMLLGGIVCSLAGLAAGEAPDVDPAAFSARSWIALAYLVAVGSWFAFTAYAWLLQNAPISRVATYAYVNPVVAIVLGWLVLDEVITPVTLIGAAIIVVSVALVVRIESLRTDREREPDRLPDAGTPAALERDGERVGA
jgi:drug/metabolite transporter (DMT)-like permease